MYDCGCFWISTSETFRVADLSTATRIYDDHNEDDVHYQTAEWGAMKRQTKLKIWSGFSALLLTLVAGWSGLTGFSFALFCLGILGAIPMIMIEGVHGGGTHAENMIGGAVFVVVNFLFYYFGPRWLLGRMFRMADGHKPGNQSQAL
jgi:hypothetical protein